MIRYEVSSSSFNKIPGYTIAYWVSENFLHNFDIGKRFDSFGEPKSGVMTGDDNKFIRHWFEIEKPISPADLGLSNDKRKLGIGFKTMTIRERK